MPYHISLSGSISGHNPSWCFRYPLLPKKLLRNSVHEVCQNQQNDRHIMEIQAHHLVHASISHKIKNGGACIAILQLPSCQFCTFPLQPADAFKPWNVE